MSFKCLSLAAVFAGILVLGCGCSTELAPEPFDADVRLTAGQVKMTVKAGVTSQADIFRAIGAPNVVMLENGKGEVWTYDQIRVRRSAQGYGAGAYFATIFGFGDFNKHAPDGTASRTPGHGAGEAGVQVAGGIDLGTTSVQTATLIVRFDANEKVVSYKMLVTSF